jgi:uncharacterized RDD family membrane protein YckC
VLDAALLDGTFLVVSAAIAFLIRLVFGGSGTASGGAVAVGVGFWVLAGLAYVLFFWGTVGQTPGARFLGTRLLSDGVPGGLGLRRALRRVVGTVLAAIPLGLGFLGILTREGRTAFNDRFAGTEVAYVRDEPRAPWAGPR